MTVWAKEGSHVLYIWSQYQLDVLDCWIASQVSILGMKWLDYNTQSKLYQQPGRTNLPITEIQLENLQTLEMKTSCVRLVPVNVSRMWSNKSARINTQPAFNLIKFSFQN